MANTPIPLGGNSPGVLQVGVETAVGTASAAFQYLRVTESVDLSAFHRRMFPDPSLRGTFLPHAHIPGNANTIPDGSAFDLVPFFSGIKTTAPSGTDVAALAVDATGYPLAMLMEAHLGGESAVDSYTTLTAVTQDEDLIYAAATDGFTDGAGFVVNTGTVAAPQYEVGFAKTINDGADSIVPRVSLTQEASDAGGQALSGGLTWYPTAAPSKTVSVRWLGPLVDTTTPYYATVVGCAVESLKIAGKAGELPLCTFGLKPLGNTWTDDSSSGASAQTWSYPQPEQLARASTGLNRWNIGGTDYYVSEWEFNHANGFQPIPADSATYHVAEFCKTGSEDVATLNLKIRADETIVQTFRAAWEGQSTLALQGYGGSAPGKMWGIAMPATHISAFADPVEVNGVAYMDITLRCISYSGDTAGGIANKPFYIFMG